VDVVRGDLLTWMRQNESSQNSPSAYGSIDLLIFNPPYVRGANGEGVPSIARLNISGGNMMSDHQLAMMTDAAWLGGGPNGVDVLQRYIFHLPKLVCINRHILFKVLKKQIF